MLDIRELEYWISRYEEEADKLEQLPTLSALYLIRDRLAGEAQAASQTQAFAYSEAPAPDWQTLGLYGGSDFLRAVDGKDPSAAWSVMDELMETLRVVNPRAYDSVLRKINRL